MDIFGDPDFSSEQNPKKWTLQNPVWVTTPPFSSSQNCEALRFGSETGPSPWFGVGGFDPSSAACVGAAAAIFGNPGDEGGGFAFQSSNGCNCMASAVLPTAPSVLGGGDISVNDLTPCYTSNVGLFGVYDAPRT